MLEEEVVAKRKVGEGFGMGVGDELEEVLLICLILFSHLLTTLLQQLVFLFSINQAPYPYFRAFILAYHFTPSKRSPNSSVREALKDFFSPLFTTNLFTHLSDAEQSPPPQTAAYATSGLESLVVRSLDMC